MQENILKLLKNNANNFISGEKISNHLGVSRAAIWKHINQLKNEGYVIESVSRNGYKLISSPDILSYEEIQQYLKTNFIGRNIIHFDTINSTNTKAKDFARLGEKEGTILISEEQTAGKGRLGRNWISPTHKGIWMSIILRPNINPMLVSSITLVGAAAVYKALENIGIKALIKWPNDIILNNKKICGILTEMSGELNQINYIVMGIGINVNIDENELPEEIDKIATSIKIETGTHISRQILTANILNNFEDLYTKFIEDNDIQSSIDICKNNSLLIGKEIEITEKNEIIKVTALDIDNDGKLVVKFPDGTVKGLISGEVSMHGIYGYK